MLLQYAREHHFPNPTFFVDDGVSGVTYDRPGFQAMLAEIEAGRVAVAITKDLSSDIAGKHIIVVEDILDSGNTLSYLLKLLAQRKPASIRLCTLLDKPERRTKPVEVHYSGFTIPDAFVVGYGLDYAEHYRNLPYIGILKPEVYGG